MGSPFGASSNLSAAQRQILIAVKRRGEASADELAEALAITPSAVRQHLATLKTAGFVASRQMRGRPGRPADLYHSTELGETLSTTESTPDFSVEILGLIEHEDPKLIARIFDRRRRRRVEQFRERIAGKTLGEALAALAADLDDEGYMAHVDDLGTDGYRLTLHSCPIWMIASHYGQACNSELDFMRELLPDLAVERVIHKVAGAYVCAYEIKQPGGGACAQRLDAAVAPRGVHRLVEVTASE